MAEPFNRLEIDGVPVYWADAPPFSAALLFRVGIADEQYLNRGITHLTEHMALDRFFSAPFAFNGATSYEITSFSYQGDRTHFPRFVSDLAAHFSDPGVEHFDREREVLRSESAGRDPGAVPRLYRSRYGHRGPGLLPSQEWGLGWLSPTHVGRWGQAFFNRSNVVAVMSGEPPADLMFQFPEGERSTLPVFEPARPGRRLVRHGTGGTVFSSLVPRRHGNQAVMMVIRELAIDALRRQTGLLYDLTGTYFRADTESAIASFVAACDDSRAATVAETVTKIITELPGRDVPDDVYERVKALLRYEEPSPSDLARAEMHAHAHAEATGWPLDPLTERVARAMPDRAELAELAGPFGDTLHVMVPEGAAFDEALLAADTASHRPIDSANVANWTGGAQGAQNTWPGHGSRLSFDEHHLQVTIPEEPALTISFDDIVAVIIYRGHEIWLVAADGTEFAFWQGDWSTPDPHFWPLLWERIPWQKCVKGFDEPFVPSPRLLRLDRNY